MESEYKFDPIDIMRFMPVAVRQATRKGFLKEIKMGNDFERKYFVLCGNLLYSFLKENDLNTLCGIMFLESSILKIVTNVGALALSVSAVGGKTLLLTSDLQTELVEWMEAIENSKFISLSRKLDDTEARLLQLNHQVEQQEVKNQEYTRSFVDMKEAMNALNAKNAELEATIVALKQECRETKNTLRSTEKERSLLLKSRGITPKELPLWALSEVPRGGVTEPPEKIRIWTGTWNLGSGEPFAGMDKNRAQRLLQPLVPSGYDLYVLGVQECVSDSVFDSLNGLLEAEGCRRLRLDNSSAGSNVDTGVMSISSSTGTLAAPIPSCTGIPNMSTINATSSSDMSKLVGRGDGSLLSMKFTGIAVYAHVDILPDVRVLSITNIPFSTKHSTGGVAVALSVMGRTMVFVCCQLDHKSHETRKDQYTALLTQLGSQLAETGFHLNEQFHHIIWCGDFSYTLVDTSGKQMPADTVVKMLQDGRLFRTLFDTHDQLNQERREKNVFFMYREAAPFPNFYPTSKKVENRNPVDYAHPSWVSNTYRTYTKAPFYKGGGTKEYTPAFSDRVLYHSMVDLSEDMVPECKQVEMSVHRDNEHKGGDSDSGSSRSSKGSGKGDKVVSIVGAGTTKSIAVTIDNYRSVNDGEGLNVSHHSPVYGTFVLRLRHNFDKILEDSVQNKSVGSIGTVLSALSSGGNSNNRTVEFPIDTSSANVNGSSGSSVGNNSGMMTPPRSKSSRYSSGATDPTHKRSNLSHMLQNTEPNPTINTTTTNTTTTITTNTTSVPRALKYSLLPPGVYRVKITNIKLLWGMNEESPASVSLLFPAPYEAVAGERFVDFKSDTDVTPLTTTSDDTFNLSSVSSSIPISSGANHNSGLDSPARNVNSGSQVNSGSLVNTGSFINTSSYVSTSGIANYSNNNNRSSRNLTSTNTSSSVPSTPTKIKQHTSGSAKHTSTTTTNPTTTSTSTKNTTYELWERCAPSRTGTCLALCAGAYYKQQATGPITPDPSGGSGISGTRASAKAPLAPLVLTWRGQEPLDKLHLALRVCIPAFSLQAGKSRPGSARIDSTSSGASGGGSGGNRESGEWPERDVLTGHCAIGMEQLCKVAMVSSGGIGGCVTVTRILVNQGRPMYNIDHRTLQREMVTLCCSMELLPNETSD